MQASQSWIFLAYSYGFYTLCAGFLGYGWFLKILIGKKIIKEKWKKRKIKENKIRFKHDNLFFYVNLNSFNLFSFYKIILKYLTFCLNIIIFHFLL